jgi:ribosomal protein S6--L-glutamate ligase
MHIAILSRGDGWHVQDLIRAAAGLGHSAEAIDFRRVSAGVPGNCSFARCDAAIIRTMPAGSLEQVVFRMDVLHAAAAAGKLVLNPPRAVETCVDKYLTNVRLAQAGLPTPATVGCQLADDAIAAFDRLGGDVVVKPLFGAEGRGMVRVSDPELAWRTFHAIEQTRGVIYLQRFVRHPGWDVRAFVLNGRVIAAMKRASRTDWRTNVALGGTAERCELARPEAELAVRAAAATGAVVAGVDLLPDERGEWLVIEVNAVPGWRALAPACGIDVAAKVVRFLAEEWRPS